MPFGPASSSVTNAMSPSFTRNTPRNGSSLFGSSNKPGSPKGGSVKYSVPFHFAGFLAATCIHLVEVSVQQQAALLEFRGHVRSTDEGGSIDGFRCEAFGSLRADGGEFLVLRRRGCATHTNRADDLPLVQDRHPALQRHTACQ